MSELIFLGYDHREMYKRISDFVCNKKVNDVIDKSRIRNGERVYIAKVLYEEETNNV